MIATHFITSPNADKSACGRGNPRSSRFSENTFAVDCGSCIIRNSFQEAHQRAVLAKEAAFQAQTPVQVGEPWKAGIITCTADHDTFRYRGRSCMGHYDDWVCATCDEVQSRLTETGMSF